MVLDRLRAEDMEAHLAGEDEEQARRLGWWPKRSGPEQFRKTLADDEREWGSVGGRRRFAMRMDGVLVGGAEVWLGGSELGYMSYWTFPPFRGRGYATRAVKLLSGWAFEGLELARIELAIESDNVGSRKVATGAGFRDTGRTNEDGFLLYELLR